MTVTNYSATLAFTQASPNTGFGTAHKVTYQGKVKAYLVGTFHHSSKAMIKQSCFPRILEKCSTLYTEIGIFTFITSPHLNIPEGTHAYKHIKYRFSLDDVITLEAWYKKIPIVSLDLDQGIVVRENDRDSIIRRVHTDGSQVVEQEMLDEAVELSQDPLFVLGHDSTMKGEIDQLEEIRSNGKLDNPMFYSKYVDPREERWSQILIPIIQTTQKPICIAVGVAHLVGTGSLTDRFRKAGFQVEQLRSTCPYDWARFAPSTPLVPRAYFSSAGWLPSMIQQTPQITPLRAPKKSVSKRVRTHASLPLPKRGRNSKKPIFNPSASGQQTLLDPWLSPQ